MTEGTSAAAAVVVEDDGAGNISAAVLESSESATSGVVDQVANDWYMFLFRGIIVTGFGLFFVCYPGDSITVIANVFGSLFIIEGLLAFIRLVVSCCFLTIYREMGCHYLVLFILQFTIGVLIIQNPAETAQFILKVIAAWFIIIGILQLCFACLLVGYDSRFGLGFLGALYIVFGSLLISNLEESSELVIKIIGAVLIVFGIQLLIMAKKFRDMSVHNHASDSTVTGNNAASTTEALLNEEGDENDGGEDGEGEDNDRTTLSEYV